MSIASPSSEVFSICTKLLDLSLISLIIWYIRFILYGAHESSTYIRHDRNISRIFCASKLPFYFSWRATCKELTTIVRQKRDRPSYLRLPCFRGFRIRASCVPDELKNALPCALTPLRLLYPNLCERFSMAETPTEWEWSIQKTFLVFEAHWRC